MRKTGTGFDAGMDRAQANSCLPECMEAARSAKLAERNRMAHDIHDTLSHTLTPIIFRLSGALELLETDPQKAREQIIALCEMAREGMQEIRALVKELCAPANTRPRGREQWTRVAESFAGTAGVEVLLKIARDIRKMDEKTNEVVYRAIQEGLTNSVRHGHAQKVEIAVCRKAGCLLVRISDDGNGVEDVQPGFGLQGIRERVEALHGRLFWHSAPGLGFDLCLEIPLEEGGRSEYTGFDRGRSATDPRRPEFDARGSRSTG